MEGIKKKVLMENLINKGARLLKGMRTTIITNLLLLLTIIPIMRIINVKQQLSCFFR